MSPIARAARQTFQALRVRNYRLFFIGQVISASGTWMHAVALGLLVLSDQLHGNGFNVGIVTALQFVPMLLLGSWGGLVVDRVDKRRLLYVTQTVSGLLALALGLLVALGSITMWEVYLISTLFGVVNLFDNPARQTFVSEMVGRELLPNAISLNSVVMNSARVIGPAIGGILIFAVGLARVLPGERRVLRGSAGGLVHDAAGRAPPAPGGRSGEGAGPRGLSLRVVDPRTAGSTAGHGGGGDLRFQLHDHASSPCHPYVRWRCRHLQRPHGGHGPRRGHWRSDRRSPQQAQHRHAQRHRPGLRRHAARGRRRAHEAVALVALVFMGLCSISFISTANATIQMQADPAMRGRVMALYAIAFLGTTPIGAPLMGWIADVSSPRVAVMLGGVATLAACVPLALRYWGGRVPASNSAVTSEVPDAEPGEVVDFAPRPVIDARSAEDQVVQIRRIGSA